MKDQITIFSGSYTNEEGIILNDNFSRFTLHSKTESKIMDWLTLGIKCNIFLYGYSGLAASLGWGRIATPLADNHIGSPNYVLYLAKGNLSPIPSSKFIY